MTTTNERLLEDMEAFDDADEVYGYAEGVLMECVEYVASENGWTVREETPTLSGNAIGGMKAEVVVTDGKRGIVCQLDTVNPDNDDIEYEMNYLISVDEHMSEYRGTGIHDIVHTTQDIVASIKKALL